MPEWLAVILEILKYILPAFIMFLTVYFMMKQYHEGQYRIKVLDMKQKQQATTLPLRLQAYERLSLFCERISLPGLILRLRTDGMQTNELQMALMLAVQKEFEHNITQQVYVSEQLWEIIKIAKDDVVNMTNLVAQDLNPQSDSREYSRAIFNFLDQRGIIPLDKALIAIKKEAGLLM